RGILIFPTMELHLNIGRKESVLALEQAMLEKQQLFVTAQKQASTKSPKEEDLYTYGTVIDIKHIEKLGNGTYRIFVEGKKRAKVRQFVEQDTYMVVDVEDLEDING